jgi:hypothetical protein
VWEHSWPKADAESILALYAADATYLSQAFREPQLPEEYVRWAFEQQAEAECRFGDPVAVDGRAAVDWWA